MVPADGRARGSLELAFDLVCRSIMTNMQSLTYGGRHGSYDHPKHRRYDQKRLRVRAAIHGRSMEDEARDILRSALSTEDPRPRNLAQAIQERFGPLGGVDLPVVQREAIRAPVDFGE